MLEFKTITHEEYKAIEDNAASLQEKAIITLLGPGMITPAELLRIKREDYDFITGELLLHDGCSQTRKVQITGKTKFLLLFYLMSEHSVLAEEVEAAGEELPAQLFIFRGSDGKIRPMDIMQLMSFYYRAADRAGIDRRGLKLYSLQDYGMWIGARNAYYEALRNGRDLEAELRHRSLT